MKNNDIWPFKVPVPKMAHCADNGPIKVDADLFFRPFSMMNAKKIFQKALKVDF